MRLFVDNLTNIDFSYLCPERGLVGETWLAHVQLEGSLDQQGMICDFGTVKKTLREWLDKRLDHCLLVPRDSQAVQITQVNGNTLVILALSSNEHIRVESPSEAITLLDIPIITPDAAAAWCVSQLRDLFGDQVSNIHLSFSSETPSTPYYHYSHGLKKHQGHCQRIAHGHRSRLLIWRNNSLCVKSIEEWAERWRDVYIGTQEDCSFDDGHYLGFSYSARQGQFHLMLPKRHCYLINTDSTVERLAQHLAEVLSRQHPGEFIRVQAFEGIGKGAIAEYTGLNVAMNS